jgi:hypothetical protein
MVCMMRVPGVGIRQRRRQAGGDQQSHDSDKVQDHVASVPHWGRPIQATLTAPSAFHSPACAAFPTGARIHLLASVPLEVADPPPAGLVYALGLSHDVGVILHPGRKVGEVAAVLNGERGAIINLA